jgi:hypothetical protein
MNIIFNLIIICIIIFVFTCIFINILNNKLKNIEVKVIYPENFSNNNQNQNIEKNNILEENIEKVFYNNKNDKNKINGFTNNENIFKEWNIETKKSQVCFQNHIHKNCFYGITNYADPKDMSEMDYNIFHLNYPSNMTLQDYVNWLYCYSEKEDELPYNHLKNLKKLKMGKELIEEQGILPPNALNDTTFSIHSENYFNKMYNEINKFINKEPNKTDKKIKGYNYNNDYSEFSS